MIKHTYKAEEKEITILEMPKWMGIYLRSSVDNGDKSIVDNSQFSYVSPVRQRLLIELDENKVTKEFINCILSGIYDPMIMVRRKFEKKDDEKLFNYIMHFNDALDDFAVRRIKKEGIIENRTKSWLDTYIISCKASGYKCLSDNALIEIVKGGGNEDKVKLLKYLDEESKKVVDKLLMGVINLNDVYNNAKLRNDSDVLLLNEINKFISIVGDFIYEKVELSYKELNKGENE